MSIDILHHHNMTSTTTTTMTTSRTLISTNTVRSTVIAESKQAPNMHEVARPLAHSRNNINNTIIKNNMISHNDINMQNNLIDSDSNTSSSSSNNSTTSSVNSQSGRIQHHHPSLLNNHYDDDGGDGNDDDGYVDGGDDFENQFRNDSDKNTDISSQSQTSTTSSGVSDPTLNNNRNNNVKGKDNKNSNTNTNRNIGTYTKKSRSGSYNDHYHDIDHHLNPSDYSFSSSDNFEEEDENDFTTSNNKDSDYDNYNDSGHDNNQNRTDGSSNHSSYYENLSGGNDISNKIYDEDILDEEIIDYNDIEEEIKNDEAANLKNRRNGDNDDDDSVLGSKQTAQLQKYRIVFVLLWVSMGLTLSILLFSWGKQKGVQQFQSQYQTDSKQLQSQFIQNLQQAIVSLQSFSYSLTSYVNFQHSNNNINRNNKQNNFHPDAKKKRRVLLSSSSQLRQGQQPRRLLSEDETNNWPFITIPDFEYQAASIRRLSKVMSIQLSPKVTSLDRDDWEYYYSRENREWVQTGLSIQQQQQQQQQQNFSSFWNEESSSTISSSQNSYYYEYDMDDETDITNRITFVNFDQQRGPVPTINIDSNSDNEFYYYLPTWQNSPVNPEMINLDLHSSSTLFSKEMDLVLETNQMVIGSTILPTSPPPRSESQEQQNYDSSERNTVLDIFETSFGTGSETEYYTTNKNGGGVPVTLMYVPVFDFLTNDNDDDNNNLSNSSSQRRRYPVAILTIAMHWEPYLVQILSPDAPPMHAVLSNNCNLRGGTTTSSASTSSSTSTTSFTYAISGQHVQYLGVGDFHDSKFDSYRVRVVDTKNTAEPPSAASLLFDISTSVGKRSWKRYNGIPITDSTCQYRMDLYPTQEYYDQIILNNSVLLSPWMFVGLIIIIFLVLFILVYFYDRTAEQDYQEVHQRATETNAIVSSIFPFAVRQRLYKDDNKHHHPTASGVLNQKFSSSSQQQRPYQHQLGHRTQSMINNHHPSTHSFDQSNASLSRNSFHLPTIPTAVLVQKLNTMKIKGFLTNVAIHLSVFDDPDANDDSSSSSSSSSRSTSNQESSFACGGGGGGSGYSAEEDELIVPDSGNAIADLFPDVTVMFSDIVGFDAWSSQRDSGEVCLFLQNLYQEFDSVAKSMGVYKVETIGDCYVAATGIPQPQPDHAIRIIKFASRCHVAMKKVIRRLELRLGPDTGELDIRTGIHSGSVTAGILKGDKTQFQLFGDTMNMASRMQNNSLPGRIQCSESTLELLQMSGKGHWAKPRETKIFVKGKGDVQTYWVNNNPGTLFGHFQSNNNSNNNHSTFQSVSMASTSDDEPDTNMVGGLSAFEQSSCDQSVGSYSVALTSDSGHLSVELGTPTTGRVSRLIDWNVQLLSDLLKRIEAKRQNAIPTNTTNSNSNNHQRQSFRKIVERSTSTRQIQQQQQEMQERELQDELLEIDDAVEFIKFPFIEQQYNNTKGVEKVRSRATYRRNKIRACDIELGTDVQTQLRDYVTAIASMYRRNAFHSFEHASHVTMNTNKLLLQVNAAGIAYEGDDDNDTSNNEEEDNYDNVTTYRSDYTAGITSDPMTQFALVFCGLVHDVDHMGVSNEQLIREKADIAEMYNNKSIAERNSIDIAWDLLMDPIYVDLQKAIHDNRPDEMKRFRQLLVNIVLATDISDRDTRYLREKRWDRAFGQEREQQELRRRQQQQQIQGKKLPDSHSTSQLLLSRNAKMDRDNLRTTVILEHLMQASDISHMMHHWDIYLKWNERLFNEMYGAYKKGRSAAGVDPSATWYEGEVMFFDLYVIPLASKIAESRILGVSSHECLTYARQNRKQWAIQGEEIVEEFRERYEIRTARAAMTTM